MVEENAGTQTIEESEDQGDWLPKPPATAQDQDVEQAIENAVDTALPGPRDLVESLRRLKPHDHLCLICDDPEEWPAAIVPYLKTGLERGEKCVYVVDDSGADHLGTYLRQDQMRSHLWRQGVDVTATENSGQLVILRESEACTRSGSMDPEPIIGLLVSEAEQAVTQGFSVQRVVVEMTWALQGDPAMEKLATYEAKLSQYLLPKYSCMAMCQYDRSRFDEASINNAVMAHPLLVLGNSLYGNSYYVPPEDLLSHRLGERAVQRWLLTLEHDRESRDRIQFIADIMERSAQPFSATYADRHIMISNAAFRDLTGYGDDELSTMTWLDLTPREQREYVEKVFADLCSTGQPQRFERELLRKDGSRIPTEVFVDQIVDSAGKVQYWYALTTDVGEQRREEEALRKTNVTLSSLMHNLPGIAYRCANDERRSVEFVSQGCLALTGYQPSDLEQDRRVSYAQLIHPEDRERSMSTIQAAIKEGRPFQVEYRVVTNAGAEKWVWDQGRALRSEQGDIIGLEGFVTNISERKQMEKALVQTTSVLQAILRALPDTYFRLSSSGVILDYNGGESGGFFAPRQSLIRKRIQEILPGNLGLQFQEAVVQVLRTNASATVDYALPSPKGEQFFEARLLPLVDTQVIVVIRNVSKHKQTEQSMRESLERMTGTLDGAVRALAGIAERRDPYATGHQERVRQLATAIAREMGLPQHQIEGVQMSAALHDIGKIYIPAEILNKPGQLSEIEMDIVRSHPQVGHDILKPIDFPWPVAQIVLQHHERLDGSGYPVGLSGDNILLEAKILGVADVVESMSTQRPHRPPRSMEETMEEIAQGCGTLYDPAVVDACRKVVAEMPFE